MKKTKITHKQKNLKKKITNKKYSKFGFLSELDETQLEVYAGHPICWLYPDHMDYSSTCLFNTVQGWPYDCGGWTTTTYCAS